MRYLCSCVATCTDSMMRRRASEICLARTVCCSNLVFTADWEMHSCNTHTHGLDRPLELEMQHRVQINTLRCLHLYICAM